MKSSEVDLLLLCCFSFCSWVLIPDMSLKWLDLSSSASKVSLLGLSGELQRLTQPCLGIRAARVGWSSCKPSASAASTAARREILCRAPQSLCCRPCVAPVLLPAQVGAPRAIMGFFQCSPVGKLKDGP